MGRRDGGGDGLVRVELCMRFVWVLSSCMIGTHGGLTISEGIEDRKSIKEPKARPILKAFCCCHRAAPIEYSLGH